WRDVEGRADVVSWVKEAYFALRASDSVQVLDQVRDELVQADIAFGPILEEARLELQASREQTLEAASARDALHAERDDLAHERADLAHEVERVGTEARRLTAAVGAAQRRADAAVVEAASTREALNTAYTEVDRLRAAAEEAVSRAAALEADASAERD